MKENDVSVLEDFIRRCYYKDLLLALKNQDNLIIIDYKKLEEEEPELADKLIEKPLDIIKKFHKAIEEIDLPSVESFKPIPRFLNIPDSQKVRIRDIRSKHLKKLLFFDGMIRQASDVRPVASMITYECPSCGTHILVEQTGLSIKEPSRCTCGRKGRFKVHSQELVDTQRIVVEEAPELMIGGEQPKRISVFLQADLVDPKIEKTVTPGSRVSIIGIVKEIPITDSSGKKSTRYDIIVEANNVVAMEEDYDQLTVVDEDDLKRIKELSKSKKVYDTFIKSIAPTIFGHKEVKEAIVLQMFGGVQKKMVDGTKIRGDMHILLVGDPGTGKSQILKYVSGMTPKAVYVSGKGTTSAGLTASVVKDEFLKGWSLEAGALVLANKGIACIDELDKMNKDDRVAMHEALEQQTVTINKANIHATLMAQTTVLAAANPKLGRFDPYTPIPDQIDLPTTLLNRFDLIFPIRDVPAKEEDTRIATHIIESHKNPELERSTIDSAFLRKYLTYAKKNSKPVLSDAASKTIIDFYVNIRNKAVTDTEARTRAIPINARQLEGLIRMTEASARVKLNKVCDKKDSERAIRLLTFCLKQVGTDPETGELDIDRLVSGITSLQRNRIMTIQDVIKILESQYKEGIPIEEITRESAEKGVDPAKTEEILKKMRQQGEIFEPRPGFIRRVI
ncbi:MAG: minichromosome maintenance protein MCM [Nanoarchaeota archaeon]|nr:minichromosome maintenance protein MCM [Nanoarchaeota archaeon]